MSQENQEIVRVVVTSKIEYSLEQRTKGEESDDTEDLKMRRRGRE
jgi:hypothetical protein